MPSSNTSTPSPGNEYAISPVTMRLPHLEHLYRLEAIMADREIMLGSPFNAKHFRTIMPIEGGIVKGKNISGVIEHLSGADWGTAIEGADFMKLDARYTIKTHDNHHLYIQAKGIFSAAPGASDGSSTSPLLDPSRSPPENLSQDQVEWFTHIDIEAGPGPYHWMNGVLAVGVLVMCEKRIVIDAFRLTNFPGVEARDVVAR